MHEYIRNWNSVIMNCSFDNTYKMVWAKSIVELASCHKVEEAEDRVTFDFYQIAPLCLKYYWNQTIYFDLIQGSNLKKIPEILSHTKSLINSYYFIRGEYLPIRFERIGFDSLGLEQKYQEAINKTVATLKQDVCYRFLKLGSFEYQLYELDRSQGKITFSRDNVLLLKEYSELLFEVINYRWAQILESFNSSPRISSKVRAIHDNNIKRSSLKKFHAYLDTAVEGSERCCFYCGQEIKADELSVDHVIPWSFMFSDDIWNLVYCHKGENSSKSNACPTEDMIRSLEERNRRLFDTWTRSDTERNKKYEELKLAIEKDYVRKFWMAAKG